MAGIENSIGFGEGFKIQPSSATSIANMQKTANDISNINHTGNPEGSVSANPGSVVHDPSAGQFYLKTTGTGNTGWFPIPSGTFTQHDVLIAGAANSISSVTPSATVGNPFVSNGVGADPSYSATPTVTSITISNSPSSATDGANKAYVDLIASGFSIKAAVVAATTTALTVTYANGAAGVGATLTNAGTQAAFALDGISLSATQRVLIKDQASQLQNGVYTVTTVGTGATNWVLTRATDYDQTTEITTGSMIPVTMGTVNGSTLWIQTATVTAIGTDPIVFQIFSSAPISTVQYDVLVGGANNTIVSVGPGTAGQLFQSAGNASNPGYTTSTYPSTNAISTLLYASSANVMAALSTANNGVLVTSNTGVPSILAGPGTTGNILQSNAAAAPSYSTATYPSTTTISQILYSSSTNVVSGLSTANNAVLTTGATGIPVLTALSSNGQLIIGSGSGAPIAATLTAGTGISITNAANSITINSTGSGFTWTDVTGATQTIVAQNGYITDRGGGVNYTLPASGSIGDTFKIVGKLGITTITPNANQQLLIGNASGSVGVTGTAVGTNVGDCITFVVITSGASTVWRASNLVGNWTLS